MVDDAADAEGKCESYFTSFNESITKLLADCKAKGGLVDLIKARSHADDLILWHDLLKGKSESAIFKIAFKEYEFSLLCLVQGFYRHAFSSLRLFIELTYAGVHMSANELALRMWLGGKRDIHWAELLDDNKGIFSADFVDAFCSELLPERKHFLGLSAKIYRECSEYVHGNHQVINKLPDNLAFSEESFKSWCDKAENAVFIANFVLAMRYVKDLNADQMSRIEPVLSNHLGHIESYRLLVAAR